MRTIVSPVCEFYRVFEKRNCVSDTVCQDRSLPVYRNVSVVPSRR